MFHHGYLLPSEYHYLSTDSETTDSNSKYHLTTRNLFVEYPTQATLLIIPLSELTVKESTDASKLELIANRFDEVQSYTSRRSVSEQKGLTLNAQSAFTNLLIRLKENQDEDESKLIEAHEQAKELEIMEKLGLEASKSHFKSVVTRVTLYYRSRGILVLNNDSLIFCSFSDSQNITLIPVDSIARAQKKPWRGHDTSLEIYLEQIVRSSSLFAFRTSSQRDELFELLLKRSSIKSQQLTLQELGKQWDQYKLSNYEYLMALNDLAGRTVHDVSQYPVLPWVVQHYNHMTLDLIKPDSFRNLGIPMRGMDQHRLDLIKEKKYDSLGHYSSPKKILAFLQRKHPYLVIPTGELPAKEKIICPFTSVEQEWKLACGNENQFTELIPEFFEGDGVFLESAKHQPVKLPAWAKTRKDLVLNMRAALESPVVDRSIHNWIDLIFGVGQQSDSNVYDESYFKVSDQPLELFYPNTANDTPSCPRKLFNSKHSERQPSAQSIILEMMKKQHERRLSDLKSKYESDMEMLKAEIDRLNQLQNNASKNSELETELRNEILVKDAKIVDLEKEKSLLSAQLESLTTESKNNESRASDLEAVKEEMSKKLESYSNQERELATKNEQIQMLMLDVNRSRSLLEDKCKEVDQYSSVAKDYQQQVESLMSELKLLQRDIQQSSYHIKKLEQEKCSQEQRIQEMDQAREAMFQKLERDLQEELLRERRRLQDVNAQSNEKDIQIESLKKSIIDYHAVIEQSRLDLKKYIDDIEWLEGKLSEKDEIIESLKQLSAEANNKLRLANDEGIKNSEEIIKLRTTLKDKSLLIHNMDRKLQETIKEQNMSLLVKDGQLEELNLHKKQLEERLEELKNRSDSVEHQKQQETETLKRSVFQVEKRLKSINELLKAKDAAIAEKEIQILALQELLAQSKIAKPTSRKSSVNSPRSPSNQVAQELEEIKNKYKQLEDRSLLSLNQAQEHLAAKIDIEEKHDLLLKENRQLKVNLHFVEQKLHNVLETRMKTSTSVVDKKNLVVPDSFLYSRGLSPRGNAKSAQGTTTAAKSLKRAASAYLSPSPPLKATRSTSASVLSPYSTTNSSGVTLQSPPSSKKIRVNKS